MSSFSDQFRMIAEDYERLKIKELEKTDCWDELAGLHQRIDVFFHEWGKWYAAMEQELQGRRHLQRLLQEMDWDTDALRLFWDDQLQFYDTWLNKWAEQIDSEAPRAVVSITIKQLLVLLRLARDVEVLPDAPLKDAFVFISKHLRTGHQERISYESIRKKYSQLDRVAITEVEGLLRISLDKLEEYKNNLNIKERRQP